MHLTEFKKICVEAGGMTCGLEIYYEPSVSDYVLLISHELTATGAPIALLQMGKQLKISGKRPIFATPTDGPLRQAVLNAGIPLVVIPELYSSCFVSEIRTNFELVVVCTVVGIPAVVQLEGTSTQVLWWIHECELVYGWHFLKWMPRTLSENIYPVVGGTWAADILHKYRPDYHTKTLICPVERYDIKKIQIDPCLQAQRSKQRIIFAIVGSIEKRKGQDILARAIELLPENIIEKCFFQILGAVYEPDVFQELNAIIEKWPNHFRYTEYIDHDEMPDFYENIDCLICASRDDPMPITVAEAWMHEKLVICSPNTGSAAILKSYNAGLLMEDISPQTLADKIGIVVSKGYGAFDEFRRNGGKVYEQVYSAKAFKRSLDPILQDIEYRRQNINPREEMSEKLLQLHGQIKQLEEERDRYKNDYFEVIDSRCWKATAPIRNAKNRLKRLFDS